MNKLRPVSATLIVVLLIFGLMATASAAYGDRTLKYGMRGDDVKILQQKLTAAGYSVPATGYFGSMTQNAVIRFQKAQGIKADGIVGSVTYRYLERVIRENTIVAYAKQFLGVPYVWGGTSPSGFDCSGFTHYVFLKNGIIIPRTSADQFSAGYSISRDNLRPGDLVFFTTYKPGPSHVGIYIGGGDFIHASSANNQVTISSLSSNYYSTHYIGARRVIN